MNVQGQIKEYITSLPEPKRSDMQALHHIILQVMPACKLWFFDGKNSENKTVSNPNIGYGLHIIRYADACPDDRGGRGKTREFYQIGISANKTGISVYILGIKDKTYLAKTYGKTIGKASVTGYCIKFKTLKDMNIEILETAIRYGLRRSVDNSVHVSCQRYDSEVDCVRALARLVRNNQRADLSSRSIGIVCHGDSKLSRVGFGGIHRQHAVARVVDYPRSENENEHT